MRFPESPSESIQWPSEVVPTNSARSLSRLGTGGRRRRRSQRCECGQTDKPGQHLAKNGGVADTSFSVARSI
jgi:hypothetical protein